jgi:hypothetical protein
MNTETATALINVILRNKNNFIIYPNELELFNSFINSTPLQNDGVLINYTIKINSNRLYQSINKTSIHNTITQLPQLQSITSIVISYDEHQKYSSELDQLEIHLIGSLKSNYTQDDLIKELTDCLLRPVLYAHLDKYPTDVYVNGQHYTF